MAAVAVVVHALEHAHAHRPHDVIEAFAVDASGTFILAKARSVVYQSGDSGLSWRLAGLGFPTAAVDYKTSDPRWTSNGLALVFAPPADTSSILDAHAQVVFGAAKGIGVFRSTDTGLSFARTHTPHQWDLTGTLAMGHDGSILVGARCVPNAHTQRQCGTHPRLRIVAWPRKTCLVPAPLIPIAPTFATVMHARRCSLAGLFGLLCPCAFMTLVLALATCARFSHT